MITLVRQLLFSAIVLLAVMGCGSHTGVDKPASESRPVVQQPSRVIHHSQRQASINSRAVMHYVNGLLFEGEGELMAAAREFNQALTFSPESHEIGCTLAGTYVRLRDPERALDVLSRVVPRDAEVFRLSATCYRMLGDADSYRASFLNVLRIEPDDPGAYAQLGNMYTRLNQLDSALWAYENLARLEQDNYLVRNQLGRMYADQLELEKARTAYLESTLISRSPENAIAFISLGDLYNYLEQTDSALAMYAVAAELDPENELVLNMLVSGYTRQEQFAEALPYARRIVAQMPDDATQLRRLGMIYYYIDSLQPAQDIFQGLVDGGEVNDLNHHFLGLIAADREQYQQARDQFEIMTQMADSLAVGWYNLGLACRNLDQPDEEIKTYRRALTKVTDRTGQIQLQFLLGSVLEQNEQFDDAVATFKLLLTEEPDYHQAMNYLGYMYADRNVNLQEAIELISRAVKLSPDNPAYLDSYGWVYYRLGDYDKAVEYLQKAVELDSDPVMFDHLGDALQAKGRSDRAREWWLKALELEPDNIAIQEKLDR